MTKLDRALRDVVESAAASQPSKEKEEENNNPVRLVCPELLALDLMDLEKVKHAAVEAKERFGKIDILLNNAGIMNVPKKQLSPQGLEAQIATNHFGHFLFTELLLDHLNDGGRIVNVSSCYSYYANSKQGFIDFEDMHFERREYDGWVSYAQSKLANVLHAMDLSKRPELNARNITAVSLHPGAIGTDLTRHTINKVVWAILRPIVWTISKCGVGLNSVWEGSQTSLHCCLNEDVGKQHNGAFFSMSGKGVTLYYRKPELNVGGWPMRHPGFDNGTVDEEVVDRFRDASFETLRRELFFRYVHDAGVVEQDVDFAKAFLGLDRGVLDLFQVHQVQRKKLRADQPHWIIIFFLLFLAGLRRGGRLNNVAEGPVQFCHRARRHDHGGTLRVELLGATEPDPSTGAGDQNDLPGQTLVQVEIAAEKQFLFCHRE